MPAATHSLASILSQVPMSALTDELRRRKRLHHSEHWPSLSRVAQAYGVDPADLWIEKTKLTAISDARIAAMVTLRKTHNWLAILHVFNMKTKEAAKYYTRQHEQRMTDRDYAEKFNSIFYTQ